MFSCRFVDLFTFGYGGIPAQLHGTEGVLVVLGVYALVHDVHMTRCDTPPFLFRYIHTLLLIGRSPTYMNSVRAPYPAGIVPCLTVDLVQVGARL